MLLDFLSSYTYYVSLLMKTMHSEIIIKYYDRIKGKKVVQTLMSCKYFQFIHLSIDLSLKLKYLKGIKHLSSVLSKY